MNEYAKYQLRLAKERREDEFREAAAFRQFGRPSRPIRQRVGQSIVRLGERLSGEPSFELARLR